MRLVCLSDTHGYLPDIPECDLLLIAGDICPATNHDVKFQAWWLGTAFRNWLEKVPAKKVVGVAGNHDFVFERAKHLIPLTLKWEYLNCNSTEFDGIKIWGSPWQPWFYDWAFNAPKKDGEVFLDEIYAKIPADTDIVISHGPPSSCGKVDEVPPGLSGSPNAGAHVGSLALYKHLNRVKPKLVVCGHIHSGRIYSPIEISWLTSQNGLTERLGTVVNASYIDEQYRPTYPPLVFEWETLVRGHVPASEDYVDARDERYFYPGYWNGGFAYMHDPSYLTDENIEKRKENSGR